MNYGIYISHPEVNIDRSVPVKQWGLSETGQMRAHRFAAGLIPHQFDCIYSSAEQKARDLAHIIGQKAESETIIRPNLGENDRSSTGFLEPEQFENHVKRFFAQPDQSVEGWETARDAQIRIVGEMEKILEAHNGQKPIIVCGHGGVGTLLKCHMGRRSIAQSEDQRVKAHKGGGNIFAFGLARRELLCDWTPMEDWTGLDL